MDVHVVSGVHANVSLLVSREFVFPCTCALLVLCADNTNSGPLTWAFKWHGCGPRIEAAVWLKALSLEVLSIVTFQVALFLYL